MEQSSEIKPNDLILFIKQILQCRAFPINYTNLRDLVMESESLSKSYADTITSDEKFVNYLLAHSEEFSVAPDGSVILFGATEYVFPQSVDMVDSIAISDDSYFGDQEEYISDSDRESNASVSSRKQLLTENVPSNLPAKGRKCNKETIIVVSSLCGTSKSNRGNTTSSSDSSNSYLSSDNDESSSTDSGSSFESCDENHSLCDNDNVVCSCSSSSPSFSSCSDS